VNFFKNATEIEVHQGPHEFGILCKKDQPWISEFKEYVKKLLTIFNGTKDDIGDLFLND